MSYSNNIMQPNSNVVSSVILMGSFFEKIDIIKSHLRNIEYDIHFLEIMHNSKTTNSWYINDIKIVAKRIKTSCYEIGNELDILHSDTLNIIQNCKHCTPTTFCTYHNTTGHGTGEERIRTVVIQSLNNQNIQYISQCLHIDTQYPN